MVIPRRKYRPRHRHPHRPSPDLDPIPRPAPPPAHEYADGIGSVPTRPGRPADRRRVRRRTARGLARAPPRRRPGGPARAVRPPGPAEPSPRGPRPSGAHGEQLPHARVESRVARGQDTAPSRTGVRSSSSPSRVSATVAMATTSSACRSTIAPATGSPPAAVENSTGASSCLRTSAIRPRCSASTRAYTVGSPKWAGSVRASAVASPRPSSARAACHSASSASPQPPPQSPEMRPRAGKRAVRPSGSMPTQLMPAPHTTATPRGSATPARRIAKVSLRTSTLSLHARAWSAAASRSSSTGRSALARHAETWSTAATPASAKARATTSARVSTARSTPTAGGRKPPPRAVASTSPPAVTTATSVLLLPASTASTVAVTPTPGAPGCGRSAGR